MTPNQWTYFWVCFFSAGILLDTAATGILMLVPFKFEGVGKYYLGDQFPENPAAREKLPTNVTIERAEGSNTITIRALHTDSDKAYEIAEDVIEQVAETRRQECEAEIKALRDTHEQGNEKWNELEAKRLLINCGKIIERPVPNPTPVSPDTRLVLRVSLSISALFALVLAVFLTKKRGRLEKDSPPVRPKRIVRFFGKSAIASLAIVIIWSVFIESIQPPLHRAETSVQFPDSVAYDFETEKALIESAFLLTSVADRLEDYTNSDLPREERALELRSKLNLFESLSERQITIGFTSPSAEQASAFSSGISEAYAKRHTEEREDVYRAELSRLALIVQSCDDWGVRDHLRKAYLSFKESSLSQPTEKLRILGAKPAEKVPTDWIGLVRKSVVQALVIAFLVTLFWLMFASNQKENAELS